MTGDEHEAQQVVADVVIDSLREVRHSVFPLNEIAPKLLMLFVNQRSPAEVIDRSMLSRSHEPGARIFRHA
ncbi:MAG TPA: hypothetical protein VJU82_10100 [Acidobacteriaceae bacterium]|nr:hypothetical protein [Acidobacteriaceae bacterium]